MNDTNFIIEVKPVIIYPNCIKSNREQDCFNCGLYLNKMCDSPKGWCVLEYHGHRKGCPNYNKKKGCPPKSLMFDQVFDMSKPVYAIINKFDLNSQVQKMKKAHPDWSYRRCANCLYWQPRARKELEEKIKIFYKEYKSKGYIATRCPEAMGVQITETMKGVGIVLEWPPKNITYQIALAGIPI